MTAAGFVAWMRGVWGGSADHDRGYMDTKVRERVCALDRVGGG